MIPGVTNTPDLAACPFCGGPAELFQKKPWSDDWRVCCMADDNECPAFGDYDTKDKAIGAWNRRAAPPQTQGGERDRGCNGSEAVVPAPASSKKVES